MKGNINLISYDCYQQATEKQLAGLKWKENRVYYISEIHNEKMQDEIYGYNPNVKQVMMELKEKQQGMILRNPKSDAIAKAQEARIKSLEQKLSDSVPKNEYESLQKKYEELQVKYSQMKKGTLLKMYDQL